MLKTLLQHFGELYSEELGINLKTKKPTEIFKWFLASILLGARISETIAKNTYLAMKKYKLLTPKAIKNTTWKFLVTHVMAEGGYVRYDEKTSAMLLDINKKLIKQYNGDLNQLYRAATDTNDLMQKLLEFKGIGPITVNIFLRELRGIWKKANPPFSDFVTLAAKKLKIKNLEKYWQKNKIKGYRFSHFEVALLRLGKNFCCKKKCEICPLKLTCKRKIR
jgi:endonuclease III